MKICIIDDNVVLSKSIKKFFVEAWNIVDLYHTRHDFMQKKKLDYHVYILDIWLQDGNGLDIARHLREWQKIQAPILVISGYQWLQTKLEWFEIGINDYIIKPFSQLELQARIKSMLKQSKNISTQDNLQYANIVFNREMRKITVAGESINLSKKEKEILEFLLSHQDTFIAKDLLIKSIWDPWYDYNKANNTLNVSICRLRKKLWTSFLLRTLNAEGYILEKEK